MTREDKCGKAALQLTQKARRRARVEHRSRLYALLRVLYQSGDRYKKEVLLPLRAAPVHMGRGGGVI